MRSQKHALQQRSSATTTAPTIPPMKAPRLGPKWMIVGCGIAVDTVSVAVVGGELIVSVVIVDAVDTMDVMDKEVFVFDAMVVCEVVVREVEVECKVGD